jgi:predicted transcriptional regulator
MSRKRNEEIKESVASIEALERKSRGNVQLMNRLKMLRLIKEDPSRTLSEVGSLIGCSERTVHRWLKEYQQMGIEAMLHEGAQEDCRMRINQQELEELRCKLKSEKVGTLNEVQRWLKDRFGVEYSLKAVSNLLQHRLKARRVWMIP